jgi:hypothetical protein
MRQEGQRCLKKAKLHLILIGAETREVAVGGVRWQVLQCGG